jgi:hypothetical protein
MVAQTTHGILVTGAGMNSVTQPRPALLQMSDSDFPARFLQDLASPGQPQLSNTKPAAPGAQGGPAVLFQPVQRIMHLAMTQLACDALGQPRVDPKRILSAGIVIRRIRRDTNGVEQVGQAPAAWMRSAAGRFQWLTLDSSQENSDPNPEQRPSARSGQTALDALLSGQALASAWSEVTTPAFVVAPDICAALGKTVAYGLIPTASSETTDVAPFAPQYDSTALLTALPTLLQAGDHYAPRAGKSVDSRYLLDDFAKDQGASDILPFTAALRLLNTVLDAFNGSLEGKALLQILNGRNIYFGAGSNARAVRMGDFYASATQTLMGFDPSSITMPDAWDGFTEADQDAVTAAMTAILRKRAVQVSAPKGRYQDNTRLYRLRMFFRIQSEHPGCPAQLAWSQYSDLFRIAAWYENDGSGRTLPPVMLPDPANRDFLKNARPNCYFSVPSGLMNAMQGAGMSGLLKGDGGSGAGMKLDWICGFNIPLITICAFFVLNIFLSLLNFVFFWLPFIKVCIPFPVSAPSSSEE